MKRATVLTISGSDSSGLSGMQADLATFNALAVGALAAVTAITSQSAGKFHGMRVVEADTLANQLGALSSTRGPCAVKVGMVGSLANAKIIVHFLKKWKCPVVWDPVVTSTTGASLTDRNAIEFLQRELPMLTTIVTPNRDEAERLTGHKDAEHAATQLLEMGYELVVVKGGHYDGIWASDFWCEKNGQGMWIHGERMGGVKPRGLGCTFSSAIAAGLAQEMGKADAICRAKAFVTSSIRRGEETEEGIYSICRSEWPEMADPRDMPWTGKNENGERRPFAKIEPEHLGFYPIVDRAEWIERLIPSGLKTVQLRIKDLRTTELAKEIEYAVQLCEKNRLNLFVNDHWQEAIRSGAFGVHLGQEDLETCQGTDEIRSSGMRLGISTHGWAEVARAKAMGPSYIAVGPIYPTTIKEMKVAPQGIKGIRDWRRLIDEPLVAIGGITLERARQVRQAGADGIAVISDLTQAAFPEIRAQNWTTLSRTLNTERILLV